MFRFLLDVSDVDRGVYEASELRIAQHPSESEVALVARVLAWSLELDPDLSMGRGIAFPEEPSLAVIDPTGAIQRWIDVGQPSAERLHRAAKSAPTVALYAYRPLQPLFAEMRTRPVHRADTIEVRELPASLLDPLAERLERTARWSVLRSDGTIWVTTPAGTLDGVPLPAATLADLAAS